MLFLRLKEQRKLFNEKDAMASLESFFKNDSEGFAPPRTHIEDSDNTLLLMPSFTEKNIGTKIVTVAPKNKEKHLPLINGLMTLYDRNTGKPYFLIEASYLTAVRTGAIGGLAIKHFSHKASTKLGVFGTGVQGESQCSAALASRNIQEVYFHSRNSINVKNFKEKMSAMFPDVSFYPSSPEEIVKSCDIIITATNSSTPVLPYLNDDMWSGKMIVAVGSFRPNMTELPRQLWDKATLIGTDTATAWNESGDMLNAKSSGWEEKNALLLSQIIRENQTISADATIIFKSVGDPLFDVIVASSLHKKARDHGIGEFMDLY